MTIPASMPVRAAYTGDGVTVNFPVPFMYFANQDGTKQIKVMLADSDGLNEVQQIENTDFTITDAGINGTLTMNTAPAVGDKLTIVYDIPIEQLTDYREFGRLPSESIEAAFDKVTALIKQHQEILNRCIKIGISSISDPDTLVAEVERIYASIDNVDAVADDLTNVDAVSGDLTNIDTVAGSISNVNTVATDIANVNTVAGDLTNIDTVAGDKTNIDTVATDIADVNTVATNISDVNTVATSIADVNDVADDLTNIDAVAGDLTNIDAVAGDLTNIDAVNANKTNINTVAGSITNVNTVAGDIANVNTVAADKTNIDAVAGDLTNIDTVATDIADVSTVATDIAKVTAVADDLTNIDAVADDLTNIDTVATDIADVSTVAGSIANVNTVATNVSDVSTVATDIADVSTVAGSISNVNTVATDIANINTVAGDKTNIDTVAGDKTNIDTVATNVADINIVAAYAANVSTVATSIADVQTVAGDISNIDGVAQFLGQIDTVAGKASDVSTVATDIADVSTVAGDIANVNAVAADLANIDAASTYADNANVWAEGTDEQVQALGGVHSSKGWAQESATGQVNSDWTEADSSSKAYILHKPTKLSDFTDDTATTPVARATADANGDTISSTYAKTSSLAGVATSGSYADLSNKPTLGTMAAESAGDYTKSANLAAVATSGAYSDLSGQPTKLTDFTNDLPIKEGIPVSIITDKRIEVSGSTVNLYWRDPMDTIIDGFVLSSWASTTIVKKQGSEPESVDDGTVVATVTTRNQYAATPLTDTQANADQWHYRAFPLSVNGVYSLDKRNCFSTVVYGYRINKIDAAPATRVEYLQGCDNYFFDPCQMNFGEDRFFWGSWENAFFIPKPCLLKTDGTVDYYLSKTDFRYKEDGSTASNVQTLPSNGNFMCEFPSIFVKTWEDGKYIYCLFSNQKLDDDFECWATKQSDSTYADHFYLPMFEGTVVSSVMRSYASNGKPTASTTAENEATYATANGTGWNTTTWADEMLMMLLFPLLFKSTDSQSALGYGGTASSSALTVNNDAAIAKGLMYGTSGASSYGVTYLGLHNWWGHRWRRPNGLMNDNGNYKFKLTHSTVDGSTTTGYNRTANGYISSGVTPPAASQSYIDGYRVIGKFGIVPSKTSGSSTTYYCDGMWTNNGQLDQLFLGGAVNNGAVDGVFCFFVNDLPSNSYWTIGGSLSYHTL